MSDQSRNEAKIRQLPIWTGNLTLTPLKGGVSNVSYIATDEQRSVVARLGDNYPFHQVDRAREAIASKAAEYCGLSPKLLHNMQGVMIFEFLNAKTFAEADVRANWQSSLDLVKRCHREMAQHITGQGAIFWVFQILRDYGSNLLNHNHPMASQVSGWMEHVSELEAAQVPLPIVFGHHDLLPGNILQNDKGLWLIDWEYGAFGTAMFDLANLSSNNSFDESFDEKLLEYYFESKPDGGLLRAYAAMKAASALREALWGMVSGLHLKDTGIDYVAYADEYLSRFAKLQQAFQDQFK